MKNILIIALTLGTLSVQAQIKGNKRMASRQVNVSNFETLYIGLTAEYEIDLAKGPYLEITIDENLLEYVEKLVVGGELRIDQKEWIQASGPVKIKIGGKGMKAITQSSHSKTYIRNIDSEDFYVNAEVGNVILEGGVKNLEVQVSTATVDASALTAENGKFKFESWGKIIANVTGYVKTDNDEDGNLVLNGGQDRKEVDNGEIRFIKFVLKNNSANRHQFYVVGPKSDGSKFSYGFPMMPFQKRNKHWTNGTQVYKIDNLGIRKLVKTISLEDEGEVVDIFE